MNTMPFLAGINAENVNQFIYLKAKAMQIKYKDMDRQKMWIMGTKLREEDNFNVQVVTDYKRYSSLYTKCLNNLNIDFYFLEIEVPITTKPGWIPF